MSGNLFNDPRIFLTHVVILSSEPYFSFSSEGYRPPPWVAPRRRLLSTHWLLSVFVSESVCLHAPGYQSFVII